MRSLMIALMLALGVPTAIAAQGSARVSTAADRAALFDQLLQTTFERESFSPIKNANLALDIKERMLSYRQEVITADNDAALFYALIKVSNARKDRHLRVNLVRDGLRVPRFEEKHALVRFAVDYGTPGSWSVFVCDVAVDLATRYGLRAPEIGDRLLAINGQPLASYFEQNEPYHRYSTEAGLWWKFAESLNRKSDRFPSHFYREKVTYELADGSGRSYTLISPYLEPDEIKWAGFWQEHGADRYRDFSLLFSTQTYDLYEHEKGKKVILLDWYGFRENLVQDMDELVAYAKDKGLLDYAVIFDGTRARGGSRGAYAIQRLSPLPFKTTFGNLRLSDVIAPFVAQKKKEFDDRSILDGGVAETIDNGSWLMNWLEQDVLRGLKAGQTYSNNVPFKLAHLPKWSDGIIHPAKDHFKGPLAVLMGPSGGSHLDQFAAIIIDNDLGHAIGMPAGGYSNTWEWEETLRFPQSGQPVVSYMWSIGHTIRPNGEILEGNPAQVDTFIPMTADNFRTYYDVLLETALRHFGLNP